MTQDYYAVYGIYSNYSSLDHAAATLYSYDLQYADISIAVPYYDYSSIEPSGALASLAGVDPIAPPKPGQVMVAGQLGEQLAGNRPLGGVLTESGVSYSAADQYVYGLKEGKPLVVLYYDSPEGVANARSMLERTGAQQVSVVNKPYTYHTNRNKSAHYYYSATDVLRAAGAYGAQTYTAQSQRKKDYY